MDYSVAHQYDMNAIGLSMFRDGRVPWNAATPPDVASGDVNRMTGRLRSCAYCGSLHPADVAAAIRAGARGEWADWKYGWPHKAYFHGIPNPHAGLLESRSSANFPQEGYVMVGDKHWREPGKPAPATTDGKFYTVHLLDAAPEDRAVIERHLGLHFEFKDGGTVSWRRNLANEEAPHE